MSVPTLILIGSQLLYSGGDVLARHYVGKLGFHASTFLTGWFLAYFVMRTVAMFGQLYVLSRVELGKTMALFGAVSIVLSAGLGFLLLREALSVQVYIGIVLAITAFLVLASK